MFLLYVNGMEFLNLPYKYDLVPEGDKDVQCKGYVSFDDKKITIPVPWNNRFFIFNIQDTLPNNQQQFVKASIKIVESTSSAPINEILDCATEYSDYEDGLKELAIEGLPEARKLGLQFDADLLERLTQRTQNLQSLQIGGRFEINGHWFERNIAKISEPAR